MSTKKLIITPSVLSEGDQFLLQNMLTAMKGQSDELIFKALKPFVQLKDALKLETEGGAKTGIGAKIDTWLKTDAAQAALKSGRVQVDALLKELDEAGTMEVRLTDPKFSPQWKTNSEGKLEYLAIRIPVEFLGAAAEYQVQVETALANELANTLKSLKAAKILPEDKDALPTSGRLEMDVEGKFIWRVPERKAKAPKDANAPVVERAKKGVKYDVFYGDQLVGVATSKSDIVYLSATYAQAQTPPITKGGEKKLPFTVAEATKGKSYNFPNVYAKMLTAAGFKWDVHVEPVVETPAPVAEIVAEAVAELA